MKILKWTLFVAAMAFGALCLAVPTAVSAAFQVGGDWVGQYVGDAVMSALGGGEG